MKKLFLLLTLNLFCFGESYHEWVDFGGSPSATVAGCVNVITGDLSINQDDIVVRGHEPIRIKRKFYSQFSFLDEYQGWECGFTHLVATLKKEKGNDKTRFLKVPEASGIHLSYKISWEKMKQGVKSGKSGHFKLSKDEKGAISSLGELNARENPLNNVVQFKPYDVKEIIVEGSNGMIRQYRTKESIHRLYQDNIGLEDEKEYLLVHEFLPNGNAFHYFWEKYKDKHRLARVESRSPSDIIYAWVNVSYPTKECTTFETSDGRSISYYFQWFSKAVKVLKRIERSDGPTEVISHYWKDKRLPRALFSSSSFPDGRKKEFVRYDVGWNEEANVHIKEKHLDDDPYYQRIRKILAPVGMDSALRVSHRFEYTPGVLDEKGGSAKVFDAMGNLSEYYYNEKFRLTCVKHYQGKSELLVRNVFDWNEKGWIRLKTTMGKDNIPILATKYHYDERGNVVREEFLGNHSGKASDKLECTESFSIERKFSDSNLLLKEVYPNGMAIEYNYLEGSDLLSLIKTSYPGGHFKREFFIYEDSICIKEVMDDGSGDHINDLAGVTQRTYKAITPKKGSFYGFPEVIEEGYYDLNLRKEIPANREEITYSSKGLVTKIRRYDAEGKYRYALEYFYNEKDELIAQTDPLGRRRQIEYDANGNMVLDLDPNENFGTEIEYDFCNRQVSSKKVGKDGSFEQNKTRYNFLNHKVAEIDAQENTVHYSYNALGSLTHVTFPPVFLENGSEKRGTIHRETNALGHVVKEVDSNGNVTKYFRTSSGKPYLVIHPDCSEETFTYYLDGNLKMHRTPGGVETFYTYDAQDRVLLKQISKNKEVLSEEKFVYNTFHMLEQTHPDGAITYFRYDGLGRRICEETLDRKTVYEFDSLGREYKITEAIDSNHSRVIVKRFDLLDRVLEEKELDATGKTFGYTLFSYDDFSNKASTTKEVRIGKAKETYTYDPFRRITCIEDAQGNETITKYIDDYQNSFGQKVVRKVVLDPMKNQTVETLDVLGNLSTVEKFDPFGNPLVKETFSYDLNGNKLKQVSELFSTNKVIVKEWEYDARSRISKLIEQNDRETQFYYTLDGYLERVFKADGEEVLYSYDGLGRKVGVKTSDGRCHYTFEYDQMGNVIKSQDELSKAATFRSYSHFGELLEERLANHFYLGNTYDGLGRKTSCTLPDGSKVEYRYDAYHLKQVKRLDKDGNEKYTHKYSSYDMSHNLLREEFKNSIGPIEYEVDILGRRVSIDSVYAKDVIEKFDANGNVLECVRFLDQNEERSAFQYDSLNQLTQESGEVSNTYTYDEHHNRLQKNHEEYIVNFLHELERAGDVEYLNDRSGNRIKSIEEEKEIDYTFDGLNRLIEVQSGNHAVRFTYDSWGRMIYRIYLTLHKGEWEAHLVEPFLYDDQNEIGAFPDQLRILGQGKGAEIGAAIALEIDQKIYFPIHDLFGNVIAVLDKNGKIIEENRFTPFGEERRSSKALHNPWRFQSKRKIGGLVFFGRRFYDPKTGRWLSPDPKGYDEGPNLFGFVKNNPLTYFDLYGLSAESGEGYSVARFASDVGYVYYHSYRTTLEAIATGKIQKMSFHANLFKAIRNVMTNERSPVEMDHSSVNILPGKIHPDVEFIFINGIFNTKEDALQSGRFIQESLNGYQVNVMHNASHGALDLFDFAIEKVGISTSVCIQLYHLMKSGIDSGKTVILQAHSEGGTITKRALGMLTDEEKASVRFIGYGTGSIISDHLLISNETNISMGDLVALGANFCKTLVFPERYSGQINYLEPKQGGIDHGILGPTYRDKIKKVGEDLKTEYDLNRRGL